LIAAELKNAAMHDPEFTASLLTLKISFAAITTAGHGCLPVCFQVRKETVTGLLHFFSDGCTSIVMSTYKKEKVPLPERDFFLE
jgi:hypothetical protein